MKKREYFIIAMGIIACVLMCFVETIVKPGYLMKSVIKVLTFYGAILLFGFIGKEDVKELINLKKMNNAKSLILFVLLSYITIVAGFFIFKNMMDLNAIKASLIEKEHLTKQNCLFVFGYIILCNSFVEESFFRGFIFKGLKDHKVLAYPISGLLFALYHIGIVGGWFHPFVLIVCIVGLMIAGMVLDFVCDYYDSLLASYLVHGVANLAINTIGIYLIFLL